MENNKILNITSIADLQSYAGGSVIELPPFAQGQPFVARLRRPSLLMLMKNGKIPNTLLAKATQLFDGNTEEIFENDNAMSEVFDVMELVVNINNQIKWENDVKTLIELSILIYCGKE